MLLELTIKNLQNYLKEQLLEILLVLIGHYYYVPMTFLVDF
jgi:hypothetical protein